MQRIDHVFRYRACPSFIADQQHNAPMAESENSRECPLSYTFFAVTLLYMASHASLNMCIQDCLSMLNAWIERFTL